MDDIKEFNEELEAVFGKPNSGLARDPPHSVARPTSSAAGSADSHPGSNRWSQTAAQSPSPVTKDMKLPQKEPVYNYSAIEAAAESTTSGTQDSAAIHIHIHHHHHHHHHHHYHHEE